MAKRTLFHIAALLLLGMPLPALAVLGGSVDSIRADQVLLQASLTVTATGPYSVHELTSPLGMVVREYVSPQGTVFAVSWHGPFLPDMKHLLGDYFGQYSSAVRQQRERQVGRSSLNIHKPSLVMQSAGHLRAYSGRVYDPGLFPTGVSISDLR